MSRPLRLGLVVLTIALFAALAAYAWRGRHARYVMDDFCTAAALQTHGFFGTMKFHRLTWSGRYAYYPIKAIPELIGPSTVPVMPALMIALFCAAAVWTMRRITGSTLVAVFAGATTVYAALDATPEVLHLDGSLLWETGSVTYVLPLILYMIWVRLFFSAGRWRWISSAVLMLITGGLSETTVAAQCVAMGVLVLIALHRRWHDVTRIAAAGFAASVLSLVLVAVAPGNDVRARYNPPRQPLLTASVKSVGLAYAYVGSVVFTEGKSLLLVVLCGAVVGMIAQARPAILFATAAAAFGGYLGTFPPSMWALSTGPPPRALQVTNFFLMVVLFALCAAAGAARPRAINALAPALLVIAVIVPLLSTRSVLATLPEGRAAAAELDRIDRIMRASRGRDVVIQSPWALDEAVLARYPGYWRNLCMAEFYGARSLRAVRWSTER